MVDGFTHGVRRRKAAQLVVASGGQVDSQEGLGNHLPVAVFEQLEEHLEGGLFPLPVLSLGGLCEGLWRKVMGAVDDLLENQFLDVPVGRGVAGEGAGSPS